MSTVGIVLLGILAGLGMIGIILGLGIHAWFYRQEDKERRAREENDEWIDEQVDRLNKKSHYLSNEEEKDLVGEVNLKSKNVSKIEKQSTIKSVPSKTSETKVDEKTFELK